MSAIRNRRELMVVHGPELSKEQLRLKAPAALRRHLRKAQLKLVQPPRFISPMGYRFIALSTLLVILTCPAFASETLSINLEPEASVGGKIFHIGDIASFVSGDTDLWASILAEPIGYCPLPESTANLTAANVLGLLKQRGYPWQSIEISGDCISITAAPPQRIANTAILEMLRANLAEQLGVAVEVCVQRELTAQTLCGGESRMSVRYPNKPGQWLPVAVEYYVDGRLQDTLPLSQYVSFKLPVATACKPVPCRTSLNASDVTLTIQELRPGSEAVTDTALIIGLETRTSLAQGACIKLNQLKRPFDVQRGEAVTLVIGSDGVELRAVAKALNSAYTGQNVLVQREGDGLRFTGELTENNLVVVK